MGQRLEKGDLVEMMGKILTVWDQEDLHFQAEEVIIRLRYERHWYDEEGNYILNQLSEEERKNACDLQ